MSFGLSDLAQASVDFGFLLPKLLQLPFATLDLPCSPICLPVIILLEDSANAGLQGFSFVCPPTEEINAERVQLPRNKPFKNLERAWCLGGDQRSLSRREQMTDKVCNRVGFPCSRRPLHKNPFAGSHLLGDAALLLVPGFWEEEIAVEAAGRFAGIRFRNDTLVRLNVSEAPEL